MKTEVQLFSKEFYPKDVILKAIKDYRGIATIEFTTASEYFRCEFHDCVVDPSAVVLEFNNYLLELLNAQGELTE